MVWRIGNMPRRRRKFLAWSERPLPNGKARVKAENLLPSRRWQKPILQIISVYAETVWRINFYRRPTPGGFCEAPAAPFGRGHELAAFEAAPNC